MVTVKIGKNEINPFFTQIKKRTRGSFLKNNLMDSVQTMRFNVDDCFRRQVYFSGMSERGWKALKPATVERRQRRGTWRGMENSILKETYRLWAELKRNSKVGKTPGGNYYVKLYTRDPIAIVHHEGRPRGTMGESKGHMAARPPYSLLEKYQKRMVKDTTNKIFHGLSGRAA